MSLSSEVTNVPDCPAHCTWVGCSSLSTRNSTGAVDAVPYIVFVFGSDVLLVQTRPEKRFVHFSLPPDTEVSSGFAAGELLILGSSTGRLDCWNVQLAFTGGYTLPIMSLTCRAAAVLSITPAFERIAGGHQRATAADTTAIDPLSRHIEETVSRRQQLTMLWCLHANGAIVTLRWSELCHPTGYASAEGAATSLPRHVRWTLTPSPKAITTVVCLTPPTSSPFLSARPTEGEGSEAEDETGPAYAVIAAGTYPCLSAYRVPHGKRQEQSLTELAATVSDSLQQAARGFAREIKSALPAPVKRGLAGGLGFLGASGFVTAFRSWVDGGVPGEEQSQAPSATSVASQPEQPIQPALWTNSPATGPASSATPTAAADVLSPASPAIPVLRSVADPPRIVDQGVDFADADRTILSAVPDPTGRYLLCTDSFGRVTLWQADGSPSMTLLRLKKGHRDAQVGWLCGSITDTGTGTARISLQWVVYSPRRGVVDVWAGVHGHRVASHKVGPDARLVYSTGACLTLVGMPGRRSAQAPGQGQAATAAEAAHTETVTGSPRCFIVLPATAAPTVSAAIAALHPVRAETSPQDASSASSAADSSAASDVEYASPPLAEADTADGATRADVGGVQGCIVVELLPYHS